MGFVVPSPIPAGFNDNDSWEKSGNGSVISCCNCMQFRGERPLSEKLKKLASHQDARLSHRYQCTSLWVVRPASSKKGNPKGRFLGTVSDVGLSAENPISITQKRFSEENTISPPTKKQKAAPSSFAVAIADLETKLLSWYQSKLLHYKDEIGALQVQFASDEAFSKDKIGALQVQLASEKAFSHDLQLHIAALKKENMSLAAENSAVLAAKSAVLAEVAKEKRRIGTKVLWLAKAKKPSSLSFVKQLEDCTKETHARCHNRKYLARILADGVMEAYGGVCGQYLSDACFASIQAANPYRDAMEVARVMDLGSGQLNLSGLEMLRKGIEGDENGKVKYGVDG
jgi:hypothetical protein